MPTVLFSKKGIQNTRYRKIILKNLLSNQTNLIENDVFIAA